MNREQVFNKLWDYLKGNYSVDIIDNIGDEPSWLLCPFKEKDAAIHLCINGDYHKYQVFLESKGEFTTIDISVIIEDIEDHKWVWSILEYLGITRDILGINNGG